MRSTVQDLHHLDALVQSITPVIAAPAHQHLAQLTGRGQRYIVGRSGLFVEFRRAWVHALCQVSDSGGAPLPYGDPYCHVTMLCGPAPAALLQRFSDEAREACPNEHAAWTTWNERNGEFQYRSLELTQVGAACVSYIRPELSDDEHLVVDLHSHGLFPAGFSQQDDADDRGEIKVSIVLGNCDRDEVTSVRRLGALGHYFSTRLIGRNNEGEC